jgi:hypothetical protein
MDISCYEEQGRPCKQNVTLKLFVPPLLQQKSNKNYTFRKRVFVALGTQREMCLGRIVDCGLPGYCIFQHYLINGTL